MACTGTIILASVLIWASFQADLLAECENNQQEFWKSMGRIGIAQTRRKNIPMEVMCDVGSISSNIDVV